jgi:GDA1/CD39 (nucleoside phosphatase) family
LLAYTDSASHWSRHCCVTATTTAVLFTLQIYDSIYESLATDTAAFPFRLHRRNLGTIDGASEAFYAVLSTNYLEGRIDAHLNPTSHPAGVLGALDMGGASTQIIFPPATTATAAAESQSAAAAADARVAAASAAAAEATAACGSPDGSASSTSDPSVCVVDVSAQQTSDATALVAQSNASTKVSPDDFWARSHLSYGVAEVRQRVWAHLVAQHTAAQAAAAAARARSHSASSSHSSSRQQQQQRTKPALPGDISASTAAEHSSRTALPAHTTASDVTSDVAARKPRLPRVPNPCGFVGHTEVHAGHLLVGIGDASDCTEVMRTVLWGDQRECFASRYSDSYSDDSYSDDSYTSSSSSSSGSTGYSAGCPIDGVPMPALTGDFFAMSVFFYGLDCVRELGPCSLEHSWPKPSLHELQLAVEGFCSMDWSAVSHAEAARHRYTSESGLPYRCVEVRDYCNSFRLLIV